LTGFIAGVEEIPKNKGIYLFMKFIASMNFKWCIGHQLTHPKEKKSFGLVKQSKNHIHIQQKWCDPATELISIPT
jgi:hypothetical protein